MDYQKTLNSFDFQTNQEPTIEESRTATELGIKSPEMPTLNEKTISEIKAERDGVQVSWNLFDWIENGGIGASVKRGVYGAIFDGVRTVVHENMKEEATLVKVALTPYQIRQSRDYLDHTQGVQAVCNSLPVPTQWDAKYLHYADPIQNLCIYKR